MLFNLLQLRGFVMQCLDENPDKRPSASGLVIQCRKWLDNALEGLAGLHASVTRSFLLTFRLRAAIGARNNMIADIAQQFPDLRRLIEETRDIAQESRE